MSHDEDRDELEEHIAEKARRSPEFPAMVERAQARRAVLRALAEERDSQGISQLSVAEEMDTSQPFVARLETSATDTKLSTLERYAAALGMKVQVHLISADADEPSVVVNR